MKRRGKYRPRDIAVEVITSDSNAQLAGGQTSCSEKKDLPVCGIDQTYRAPQKRGKYTLGIQPYYGMNPRRKRAA